MREERVSRRMQETSAFQLHFSEKCRPQEQNVSSGQENNAQAAEAGQVTELSAAAHAGCIDLNLFWFFFGSMGRVIMWSECTLLYTETDTKTSCDAIAMPRTLVWKRWGRQEKLYREHLRVPFHRQRLPDWAVNLPFMEHTLQWTWALNDVPLGPLYGWPKWASAMFRRWVGIKRGSYKPITRMQ